MKSYMKNHPVIFEILVVIAGFLVAAAGTALGAVLNLQTEFSTSVSRATAGILFFIIFRECFKGNRPFKGILLIIPALIVVAWNVVYHLASGMTLLPAGQWIGAIIIGLGPAIFEEVLFRGIFIGNLKENGKSDMTALLISSIFFGLIHLTNAVGGDIINVLVQTGYAAVMGLLFGAIYIRSKDIVSVMLLHLLIDSSNHIFDAEPSTASTPMMAAFIVVLVLMADYAIILVTRKKPDPKTDDKHDIFE